MGGPVRDLLLHRRSHDLDFCTSAHPDRVSRSCVIGDVTVSGIWAANSALSVQCDGARTAPKSRWRSLRTGPTRTIPNPASPKSAQRATLKGDLSRRDFTVNAMALRVPQLEFVDPFGGASDLAKGVLRTPVDPYQSFDDDPLRMMRAVRFVAAG